MTRAGITMSAIRSARRRDAAIRARVSHRSADRYAAREKNWTCFFGFWHYNNYNQEKKPIPPIPDYTDL